MTRLLIVGVPDPHHIGSFLLRAASQLGIDAQISNTADAFAGSSWRRRWSWYFNDRKPLNQQAFGRRVLEHCDRFSPKWLLATGIAPLTAPVLDDIGRRGIQRINYLTDDPWNPAHYSTWFAAALPRYDRVFSTRRANLDDIRSAGCANAAFLPFAYSKDVHYRPSPAPAQDDASGEVIFVGGADDYRVAAVRAVCAAGLGIRVYGDRWRRVAALRHVACGSAAIDTIRRATGAARVALCLVRRANRDGHVMRSFEIPAIGACMLAEDTPEHREIFGDDDRAVRYFRNEPDMIGKLRALLDSANERSRLSSAAHHVVTSGGHTYRDRLQTMLSSSGA